MTILIILITAAILLVVIIGYCLMVMAGRDSEAERVRELLDWLNKEYPK